MLTCPSLPPPAAVHLCMHAYEGGTALEFSLAAQATLCPADFDAAGTPLVCSTPVDAAEEQRRYSNCTGAGECVCTGPYAKPAATVYPGLGFEDCSATVMHIPRDQLAHNSSFLAEHQSVDPDRWCVRTGAVCAACCSWVALLCASCIGACCCCCAGAYWLSTPSSPANLRRAFFKLHVAPEDHEVVITVTEEAPGGFLDLYVKEGQPPGTGLHEFDFRPEWNAVSGNRQLQVVISVTSLMFRCGQLGQGACVLTCPPLPAICLITPLSTSAPVLFCCTAAGQGLGFAACWATTHPQTSL